VVVERLLSEGDEVRVIAPHDEREWYRSLGARVAVGDPLDPDLVERSSQGARTVVFLDVGGNLAGHFEFALEGARHAGVGRVIVSTPRRDRYIVDALRQDPGEHVYLIAGGRFRRRLAHQAVAKAVNAADDLAGTPRLQLDLTTREGWASLGLDPG
jgi:hypothetical protein